MRKLVYEVRRPSPRQLERARRAPTSTFSSIMRSAAKADDPRTRSPSVPFSASSIGAIPRPARPHQAEPLFSTEIKP